MLSLLYKNAVYDRLQPTRVKLDSIGIGLAPTRDAQTPVINLTPGYQYLAVGEQSCNVFALAVDRGGVAINSKFPDRSDANGQASLFVDGDVRITGVVFANSFIGAPTVVDPNGGEFNTSTLAWGIALPSLGTFYDNPVLIGTSNQALYNTNGLQIFRSTLNYSWDNAQMRIDNQFGAQLNLGVLGNAADSPAIVNTPPGVGLEFHAGRPTSYFTSHYTESTVYGGVNTFDTPLYTPTADVTDYPHLIIDANGNVGIHTNIVATYTYDVHSVDKTHGYAPTSFTLPVALDVHGIAFASNLLIYDYVTEQPQVLDNIYFRRSGIAISACNIGAGNFLNANYRFPCNIAIVADVDDRYVLNVDGDVQITDTLYVRTLTKTDQLQVVQSDAILANVVSDLTVGQRLFLQGDLLVKVDTPHADVRSSNIALTYFGSNGAWYDTGGNIVSANSNVIAVPFIETYDGYFFAGETFTFEGGNNNIADTWLSQVASNLFVDPSGHQVVVPSPFDAAPTLRTANPTVVATMTSNFVVRTYEKPNFIAENGTLSNVHYFGTGMSIQGRFGCGIRGTNSVNSQLVTRNSTPEIFGLEVTDGSDSKMTRSLFVGSVNYHNATNPNDFGATLFITPASDDPRFYSPAITDREAFAQHMYFMPGYDIARTVLETDASLTPTLALMGDQFHNVGIHTRHPTHTLHVEGDIYFSGSLSDASKDPLTFFHNTDFSDVNGHTQTAATFLTSTSNAIKNMAIFTAPDSRYGLCVGNNLMANQYYTADNLRLGEIVFQDTVHGATPRLYGKNMYTLHNLCIGSTTPNSALALEITSPLQRKTRARITRNAASPEVSLEIYVSSSDIWTFTGNTTGTFTLKDTGSNVPLNLASTNAIASSFKAGAYRVGINTSTALYDPNNAVLMVNGNATIAGDLNVTGRYLKSGQVIINALLTSNAAAAGSLIANVTLGDEDVFVGGDRVYVNPQTALFVGVVAPPTQTNPSDTPMLQVNTSNSPLAMFTTLQDTGFLEIATTTASSMNNRVRMMLSPNRFDFYNTSSVIPMMTFYSANTNLDAPFSIAFNTLTCANNTTFQVHDTTGGLNHSLMISCDASSTMSAAQAPSLTLAKVSGTDVNDYWSLSGPHASLGTRLSFFYNSSEIASLLSLEDGCFSMGTPFPQYGIDIWAGSKDGATIAARSTTPGTPATLQLTGGTGTAYTITANDESLAISQTYNDVLRTVMKVDVNGNVGVGFDAEPAGYGLNVNGVLNVKGGIYVNDIPIFSLSTSDYVLTNSRQYLLPQYNPADQAFGGTSIGVATTRVTSNLFYISNHSDGGCAVFQSETPDAHIDLYSMPTAGAYPQQTESVGRFGIDNSTDQPGMYLAMRPNLGQTSALYVDPSDAGMEHAMVVVRTSNSTFESTFHGDLRATRTLAASNVTDGVATMCNGQLTALSARVGALHVESNVLIAGQSNASLAMQSSAGSLVVSVDGTSGTSSFHANDTYAIALDATSVQFQLPIAADQLAVNRLSTRSSNAVYVDNLNVTGSLTVNGLAFADFPHSEFLINNTDYVIGLGGVRIVGNEIGGGNIYSSTQFTIGAVADDMTGMMTSNTALLALTGATAVNATPTELIQLVRPGSNAVPSARAAMAVSRYVASGADDGTGSRARLDILLSTSNVETVTSALTLVSDALGHPMVGVGTIPRFALDVHGDINITGSFFQAAENVNINNVILISPSALQFADSNVVITSRYCGIGTAAVALDAASTPLDVYNNVGTAPIARFTTANATGSLRIVADGTTAALSVSNDATLQLGVGNASIGLSDGLLRLGTSVASNAAVGIHAWRLQSTPGGTFSLRDTVAQSDRITVDAVGNVGILGYSLASLTGANNAYTALGMTGPGKATPFVYFYGHGFDGGGGVSIGGSTSDATHSDASGNFVPASAYPFTVLADTLGNGVTSGGVAGSEPNAQFINSMPLRLMVSGAISCYAISSFTGQHLVIFNHPKYLAEYQGLIVALTGRFNNDAYTIEQSTPIVEFARSRCDKAAYGILCSCSGGSPYAYVCLVNSVGEGAMWVCDVNGDINIGDFITTSSVAGYGMRQADDVAHGYTVAKASTKVAFGNLPPWIPRKKFRFTDPYDREIKFVNACFIPVTYHCA